MTEFQETQEVYTTYAFNDEIKPSGIQKDILNALDKINSGDYVWVNTQYETIDIELRMKSLLEKLNKKIPITSSDKKDIAIFFLMLKENCQQN